MRANVSSFPPHQRGQIAPMLAIIIFLLFGLTGIVLDGGRIQFEKRHMQLAADAAAMGGAHELIAGKTGNDIITAARDDAGLNKFVHHDNNGGNAGNFEITVEVNNGPLSGPHTGDANYVEVIITKNYPTTFMRLIGVSQAPVLARAVAGMENYGESCVLALNPTARSALLVSGGAAVDAGCGVQVNSDHANAIETAGGGTLDARPTGIGVYGGANGAGFLPRPITGVPPMKDWLSHVPEPAVPGVVTTVYELGGDPNGEPALGLTISGGTWDLHPGLYSGSIGPGQKMVGMNITGGTINLYPGIYFLDSGMTVTAQATFRTVGTNGQPGGPGEGVMFYQTTTSDPTKAISWNNVSVVGGAGTVLKSMTSGPYKGILFFEARNALKKPPGHIVHGSAGTSMRGFLYFSKSHLDYAGTTQTGDWVGIIADTIHATGTSTLSGNFSRDSDGETLVRTAMLVE